MSENLDFEQDSKGAVDCGLNDLLFDVEMRENPMPANSEYSKIVVGQLNGGDFFLNACSPRYELVKCADIFPAIENILNVHGIEYSPVYQHLNHVRFYADYNITDKRYAYTMEGTNDKIMPMLKVQHSYNGLTKYRIIFGYFRLVCSNGLTIPVAEMKEFNLVIIGKHTSSILLSLQKLNSLLDVFASDAMQTVTTKVVEKYELLGGRVVTNLEDRITEVMNANKLALIDTSKFNTLQHIMSTVENEANMTGLGYDGRINDFLIYNAINAYLFDDSRNIAAPEKRMENDSKVLEYMLANA